MISLGKSRTTVGYCCGIEFLTSLCFARRPEQPDTPTDVKLSDITSRAAKLSWTPPYNGNSRITAYYLYLLEHGNSIYAPSSDSSILQSSLLQSSLSFFTLASSVKAKGNGGNVAYVRNITIPPAESTWTISDLSPMTNYSMSVAAANSLGISEASQPITFQTEEEGWLRVESGSRSCLSTEYTDRSVY